MKVHVFTATVLAAFASQVVMAASEGGDTWSEIQPAQRSAYSLLQSVQCTDPVDLDLESTSAGSEGGDTWSSVQALQDTNEQAARVASRETSTEYAGSPGGSEGGDTWSRFAQAPEGEPMSSTGLVAVTPTGQR